MTKEHSRKSLFQLQFPPKESLDYFNVVLDTTKNFALTVFGTSTFLFFLFPSFQVFVRDKIMNESIWFYVGSWNPADLKFRTDKRQEHFLKFNLADGDYDSQTGAIREGTVLLSAGESSLGRTGPNPRSVAKVVIFKNQCIKVLESSSHDIPGHSGTTDKSIWVRALPNACNG
jgi:hypothetical protein